MVDENLFEKNTTEGGAPYADQLDKDIATLKQQFPKSGSLYKKGREYLVFHLQSASPEVDQALAGVITMVSHRLYAQKLTIDIAPNLQQPANNVYSSLQRLETSIGLKSGKNALVKSIGCPKAREHQIGVKITYVPNPNPPARPSAWSSGSFRESAASM